MLANVEVGKVREIYDTNVFGVMEMIQAMLPLLLRSKHARIVNVSSHLGSLELASRPNSPMAQLLLLGYSTSKTALNSITVQFANELRDTPIKVNAVIERGVNDATALELVEHFRGTDVIVRFIEYMDVGNRNDWREELVVPSKELLSRIGARWPLEALERNYRGEVAQRYAFTDGRGEIGFISSVTQPFCGNCSRARLSSDGVLYTCLFATVGTSLRDALRGGASDEQLLERIGAVWLGRADRYSELRSRVRAAAAPQPKIEMYYIGG